MALQFNIYAVQKKGRTYHMVRYKDGGTWRSKFAPASLATKAETEAWFPGWLATHQATAKLDAVQAVRRAVDKYPELRSSVDGQSVVIPEAMAAEVERDGAVQLLPAGTLGSLIPWFLDYRSKDEQAKSFRSMLDTWVKGRPIASTPIAKLEPKECRDWIRSIDRAPYTVRNIVACVRTLIDDARAEGKLPFQTVNPFKDKAITEAVPTGKKRPNAVLTAKQSAALCRVADPVRRARYILALTTGYRCSELAGLQPRDFDAALGTLAVDRQMRRQAGMDTKEPKTEKSERCLPLHSKAIQALSALPLSGEYIFGKLDYWQAAEKMREDLLAAGESDQFRIPKGVRKGELIPLVFHDLRATFVDRLRALGVGSDVRRALMGHAPQGAMEGNYLSDNLDFVRAEIEKLAV